MAETPRISATRCVQGERWPALMTRATAAAYLDGSEATLERQAAAGTLPAPLMFDGEQMWRRTEIDEALARLRSEPSASNAPRPITQAAKVPDVYSVATLAEHWGCGHDSIYSLVKGGELQSFKLGGKLIRIRRTAVEAFERSRLKQD